MSRRVARGSTGRTCTISSQPCSSSLEAGCCRLPYSCSAKPHSRAHDHFGIFSLFAGIWGLTAAYIALFIMLEHASRNFKRLQPQLVSIYDPYFWWHERYWKLSGSNWLIMAIFAGTPFRHVASRYGCEGRCQAVRFKPVDHGTPADRDRRSRQSERGRCVGGTLARGRRVQVRLHPAWQQMLGRPWGLSSLRRQHRRRRRARRQFVPDEGRDPGLSYWVVRKSGHVGTPPCRLGPRFASRTLPTLPSETSSSRSEDVVFQRNDRLCQAQESDRRQLGSGGRVELGAGQEDLVTSNLYSVAEAQFDSDARHLCREACRRLPDVQRAENEGQGEGSFDLSIHDPVFLRAIDALAVPGLLIGHRVISQGDELAPLHEEMASLSFSAIERRLASGAARRVARELMNSMGFAGLPILRSTFGAPVWPAGIVGSMAHDDRIAVAAVGLSA